MGMARGKVGDNERPRTARDPKGASAKVEGTPVPVLSATLPTEDAIWSFLRESEERVMGSRCATKTRKTFREVGVRGQRPDQGLGGLGRRQHVQASNLRGSGWPSTLTVLKWRRRLLYRNNTGRNYFLLQSSARGSSGARRTSKVTVSSRVTFRAGPIATNRIVSRAQGNNPVNPARGEGTVQGRSGLRALVLFVFLSGRRKVKKKFTHVTDTFLPKGSRRLPGRACRR